MPRPSCGVLYIEFKFYLNFPFFHNYLKKPSRKARKEETAFVSDDVKNIVVARPDCNRSYRPFILRLTCSLTAV